MWGLPPSDNVLHVLSLVALAAQAMTAALAAGRRVHRRAFATCAGVTNGAALPQEFRM
jgi:hypothetical protein